MSKQILNSLNSTGGLSPVTRYFAQLLTDNKPGDALAIESIYQGIRVIDPAATLHTPTHLYLYLNRLGVLISSELRDFPGSVIVDLDAWLDGREDFTVPEVSQSHQSHQE